MHNGGIFFAGVLLNQVYAFLFLIRSTVAIKMNKKVPGMILM